MLQSLKLSKKHTSAQKINKLMKLAGKLGIQKTDLGRVTVNTIIKAIGSGTDLTSMRMSSRHRLI